jgi:formylglycine-generating enzyme required for sulfatase activity
MKTTILASLFALVIAPLAEAQCVGDIAVDARVDGGDLGVLLANWGPVTSTSLSRACDLDGNALVNGADLGMLLANWGACPVLTWATVLEAQPDPLAVTDPGIRAAIQSTGLPWRVRDNGTGIEMLLVPHGNFQMGCIMASTAYGCPYWELPVHAVTLTNAFYLGRYEVTQGQWVAKMGSNPSRFQGLEGSPDRPVEQVSWTGIQSFFATTGFRLPTESEWEYACRAGTQTPFYNGSADDDTVGGLAWYASNSGSESHVVGGRAPNALGFYDMVGNAWEWVSDWWGDYAASAQVNPIGPEVGTDRVLRGGSWRYALTDALRSSSRGLVPSGVLGDDVGFRVARNP